MKKSSFSADMGAALSSLKKSTAPNHVVIEALAGTGKTTTLVEGLRQLRGLTVRIQPSPQQAAIWCELEKSRGAKDVAFVAFNRSIADELAERVPPGCEAMTMHSLGYRAVRKVYPNLNTDKYRVYNLIARILGQDLRELRRERLPLLQATKELVGKCKMNLTGFIEGKLLDPEDEFWDERLNDLLIHYDLDLEEVNVGELLTLTPKVLHACKDFTADGQVDFDDQIWLPVVLGLPLVKVYDLLLVDEAQDLNRCQQALAKRAGRRLILCGDPQQAIYGFAGADSESMPRMTEELSLTPQGCVTLPLTMTRRCGKAIVQEAQVFVPTFTAHESNPAGQIRRALYPIQGTRKERREIPLEESYQKEVQEGDMLLCRVNAPLVRQCFAFLRRGRRANILGRDVGTGLVSLVKRLSGWGDTPAQQEEARSVPIATFLRDLHDWEHHEISKEQAQRNPSESKLVLIADKALCLQCFADQSKTVGEMLDKINAVFTDDPTKPGIRLSSIHKAKGLEAKRVFLLRPVAEGATIPHPMAKTEWQRKQEYNLLYVAVTRAIEELVYVD